MEDVLHIILTVANAVVWYYVGYNAHILFEFKKTLNKKY
jgi:hypothetical protein